MPINSSVFQNILEPGLQRTWEREYGCDWDAATGVPPALTSSDAAASSLTAAHVQRTMDQLRNFDNVRLQSNTSWRPGQVFWVDDFLTDQNNWFLINPSEVPPRITPIAASAIYPEPVPAHLSQPELVYPGEEQ